MAKVTQEDSGDHTCSLSSLCDQPLGPHFLRMEWDSLPHWRVEGFTKILSGVLCIALALGKFSAPILVMRQRMVPVPVPVGNGQE